MRSAIDRAYEAWTGAGSPRNFHADLNQHLRYGHVISSPELFAMLRPIVSWAPEVQLAEISYVASNPDCWFVWSAAGNLVELLERMPFELPLIMFHRGGARRKGPQPLMLYQAARVRALALRLQMAREAAKTRRGGR